MFWGEFQGYRERAILAEGKPVVTETMDFEAFQKKYFRFWNAEDLPTENTFDKYQKAYFSEKEFDVEVTDGQLNLDFQGEGGACTVSGVIVYPAAKADAGRAFLEFARDKRRFYFDNYFKRILHSATNPSFAASADERSAAWSRSRATTCNVYYNDRPDAGEICAGLSGAAFAGEYEPVTFSVVPLRDLGKASVSVTDLKSDAGAIPAAAVDVGFVSYRLSRVTMEGSVYTIAPKLIMPLASVEMPKDMTRTFWLTVKSRRTPRPASTAARSGSRQPRGRPPCCRSSSPSAGPPRRGRRPRRPVGPHHRHHWYGEDPLARKWNDAMAAKSLARSASTASPRSAACRRRLPRLQGRQARFSTSPPATRR